LHPISTIQWIDLNGPPPKQGKYFMVLADSQFRVFVVDDNDIIASSMAMILSMQAGFEVTSFTDPLEALRVSRLESPDLLISDMLMPNLCGTDLAHQILEHCPNCRVMLLSGDSLSPSASPQTQSNGRDFEVLIKPVHPSELISSIHRVLDATPAQLSVNGA
jgi:DNA-binding NtrC family response regulator